MRDRSIGEAALSGWRGKVATKVAPPVARHSPLRQDSVERLVGLLFVALSTLYLVKTVRRLL